MAHFAKIDENTNEVLQVLHVNNSDVLDSNNQENETIGQSYLETHNNWPANLWIQTSYNTRNNKYYNVDGTEGNQSNAFRGNFASIGYVWDEVNQIFFPPKPFPSWTKDITNATWTSPVALPVLTDEEENQNLAGTHFWGYNWNEENQSWDLTNNLP
jgi:hypothetical protein